MSIIPENKEDVNKKMFIYLNLNDSENFQLLHNDVKKRYYFQLYGRFFTQKTGDIFRVKKIEFKIVHLRTPNGGPFYMVKNAVLEDLNSGNSNSIIDLDVIIDPIPVKNSGIDFTFEKEFDVKEGQIIDYHIKTDPHFGDRNGRPCKNKVTGGG